jgi:hypothetical protein
MASSIGPALLGLGALALTLPNAAAQSMTPAEFNAALANARVVGPAGQPELIIPIDTPGWAQGLGVTGAFRHYKGLCGPDGALASIQQLVAHAERDLTGVSVRGIGSPITTAIGDSPTVKVTLDALNPLALLYLNDFVIAAEYIDSQFQNRVTVSVTMDAESIPGSTIGTAGSTRYDISWSSYVEGLRHQSNREDDDFADALPFASLPVRFGFPGTGTTNVTSIRVTDAQLRAVFGDNVVAETESVSITLDTDNSWSLNGCGSLPSGSQLSLVDVAVHEITHGLGFTSAIADGGDNSGNRVQGLDVARFYEDFFVGALPGVSGGRPLDNNQFATFPRHGEGSISTLFSQHWYSNTADGFTTFLEEGDAHQPSHLAHRSAFADKLGIMDPVLNSGTSFCTAFYSFADLKPLDDMGWYPVAANIFGDCNGNGLLDIFDIGNGAPDTNLNNIPDSCEPFFADVSVGGTVSGLTLSQWSTLGLTTLDGFNPNDFTLLFRGATDDATINYTASTDIVARLSGHFNAPATGQYAFRVGHSDAATLRVAGQTLLAINAGRATTRTNSSTQIAPQNFINLDAGLHAFELTVILNNAGDFVTVLADAIALGDWRALVENDFRRALSSFPDCNSNGLDDQFDSDADNDGIPDDCEADCDNDGLADETQFAGDLAAVTQVGVISGPGGLVTLTTAGSSFDTEIALYDANGVLIEADDDDGPGFQSLITRTLDAGTYRLGVGAFDIVFANGPSITFPSGCPGSGDAVVELSGPSGSVDSNFVLASGRTRWFEFTVQETADCDNDGTLDSQELDCDSDAVPDDCQIFDFDFGGGVVGTSDQTIIINTIGSSFDTEIAVWDSDGVLLAQNDDIAFPNLQSEIVRTYAPGDYLLCVAGYNTVFSNFAPDFMSGGVQVNVDGCSAGGLISLEIGSEGGTDIFDLPPGRVAFFPFTIDPASPACNAADLAEPFGVLDLSDINAFATGFTAQDPIADLAPPQGVFDLSDINAFITAFIAGCP